MRALLAVVGFALLASAAGCGGGSDTSDLQNTPWVLTAGRTSRCRPACSEHRLPRNRPGGRHRRLQPVQRAVHGRRRLALDRPDRRDADELLAGAERGRAPVRRGSRQRDDVGEGRRRARPLRRERRRAPALQGGDARRGVEGDRPLREQRDLEPDRRHRARRRPSATTASSPARVAATATRRRTTPTRARSRSIRSLRRRSSARSPRA